MQEPESSTIKETIRCTFPEVEMLPADTTLARYLAQALPHLPDLLTIHDPDGTYRLVSPQIKRVTGRRPVDLIGRSPYEWIHPDDLIRVRKRYHEAILGGASVQGRFRIRHEQGHYVWMEFVGVPLFQDPGNARRVSSILTLSREVSRMVEAEQAAEFRLNHLSLMEELAHLAWFTFDFESGAVQHNEAFVELTGKAASAFHHRRDWQQLVDLADRPVLRQALSDLWRRPAGDSRTVELRMIMPLNRVRWVRVSLSLVDLGSEGRRQLFGVVLDIDELIRSREQTQRWIRQRERVGLRERQDLAHELHDEVGQILTGMRWQIEATQRRIQSGKWPDSPEDLPLSHWIDSLDQAHTTLRAIAHRLRPPLAALGLKAAIQKLAEEFAGLWLGATRMDLEIDEVLPDGDEWRVNVLLGILRESLNNVSRHAGASVVKVRATVPFDGLLRLSVHDDGVGMDVQTAQSGDTLGLTSLRERARLIDAHLSIDSAAGAGTRVTLELWMNRTSDENP